MNSPHNPKKRVQQAPEEIVFMTREAAEDALKVKCMRMAARFREDAQATRRRLEGLDEAHICELIAFDLEHYSVHYPYRGVGYFYKLGGYQ